ncbi:TetR/AcrR family transcriptional regulator [bacterium]|nr:TetR/AcrR family transcriptional regulator [bacterium]
MPKQTFFNLPDHKRNRILTIAIDEFADNPYDVASISNIVREAEIAKGSFYQYFEDKQDLYQYLIELSAERRLDLLKTLKPPDPTGGLFVYFRWLFQTAVYFELKHPGLARVSFRAFVEEIPFPEITEELRRRGTTQFFKQLLSQGILHGEINPWVDVDLAAFLIEAAYYKFGRYFVNRLGEPEEDTSIETIFDHPEAQQLLDNLMEILQGGMQSKQDQRA